MVDITAFSKRVRQWSIASGIFFFGSAFMMIVDFTTEFPSSEKGAFAGLWLFGMALGGYFYYRSLELPNKELVALAESHNGVLTLSEVAIALNVSPDLALRGLRQLHTVGIARPCWQDLDKNLWEFPDLMRLPLAQAIELARRNRGSLTLDELVAEGHSIDVAQQTFSLLSEKGLAKEDHAGTTRRLLLNDESPSEP